MQNGFIKIQRKLWDNPLSNKPNYLAIWIYLLSHANFKDKYKIINNKKILIKRGSFIGSLRKISKHFTVSISTVKYIIDYFIYEQMIEHQPNTKFSLFKIKNYDLYNSIEHKVEHHPNTTQTPTKTTKKEKKEKKEEKEEKPTPKISKLMVNILLKEMEIERPDGDYLFDNLYCAKNIIKFLQEIREKEEKPIANDNEILDMFKFLLNNMDDFHKKNATSLKYIKNNFNKIINTL